MSMMIKERPPAGPVTPAVILTRGVWRENPVLVHTLGLCSALAVTNAVANSLAMGISTMFVLVGSSVIVSSMRRLIPSQVRISTYILIIATFVAIADMVLEAIVPDVHKAMGPYIALIVTNCIVLGRQEAFASKNTIGRSALDALGSGAGFTVALLFMGIPREVLGSGTFVGVRVMPASFEPWVVMVLPPGGFLMIAILLMGMSWHAQKAARRTARSTVERALREARLAAGAERIPA
jgi:electron transport complex protein RnfE